MTKNKLEKLGYSFTINGHRWRVNHTNAIGQTTMVATGIEAFSNNFEKTQRAAVKAAAADFVKRKMQGKLGKTYYLCYSCHCGANWGTLWDCACNDKCPRCNKEIEPNEVIEIGL